jgi:hypothetical protein
MIIASGDGVPNQSTVQQLANVLVLTACRDERLIVIEGRDGPGKNASASGELQRCMKTPDRRKTCPKKFADEANRNVEAIDATRYNPKGLHSWRWYTDQLRQL